MASLRDLLEPPGEGERLRARKSTGASWGTAVLQTTFGLVGTACVTWFVVGLGGICIDGIQTNCNSSWRPVAAAFAVSVGAIVALVLVLRRSRLVPKALQVAFAWSVLMVGVMDAINLAESWSPYSSIFGFVLLLPWNLIMLAPAFVYLPVARATGVHGALPRH